MSYLLLLCSCSVYSISGVPVSTKNMTTQLMPSNNETTTGKSTGRGFQGTGRVFPSMFGSVFDSFLPFNINVPDVFSGMYSLVNQYFSSESNPRPTSSRRKKLRILKPELPTTTMEPEDATLEAATLEASKRLTNEDFEDMYEEFIRKKDEFDKLKKKKKKRKHKHDDMLHKIASHLAYLELEC